MQIYAPGTVSSAYIMVNVCKFAPKLGGQALAALRATAGENSLATGRQHTLTEAVAPLANDAARLIRALHGTLRPNRFRFRRSNARSE